MEKISKKVLQIFVIKFIIIIVKFFQFYKYFNRRMKKVDNKITVLIADDNHDFAMTLLGYLKQENDMEVVGVAKDGKEAAELISITKPDVAILDVIMPHLDGLGVLEKINESNMEKKPICIMLSAVGQEKITQKAINLGAQYYIIKPFEIDVLIKRIKEIKSYQPMGNKLNFINREIKAPYIEIQQEKESHQIIWRLW